MKDKKEYEKNTYIYNLNKKSLQLQSYQPYHLSPRNANINSTLLKENIN